MSHCQPISLRSMQEYTNFCFILYRRVNLDDYYMAEINAAR